MQPYFLPRKHKALFILNIFFFFRLFCLFLNVQYRTKNPTKKKPHQLGRLFNRQFYGLWPSNTKRLRMFIQSKTERNCFLCFCILFGTSYERFKICKIITGFVGCNEKYIVWRCVSEIKYEKGKTTNLQGT